MEKRKMENIGAEPSMLGFGCMRFPTLEDGSINEAEAEKMLNYALDHGVTYVDKRVSFYSILCVVISLLFACLMCYLWVDAAKDRDNYKRYYEYYQEQAIEQKGNK